MIRQGNGTPAQTTHAKPATMVQIAERAGVALSTVSYVLSGKRPVSREMRERVLAAIDELPDYRPHRPARALASGASGIIAIYLPWPQWQLLPLQQTFVAGATHATSESDYGLLLSTVAADPETIAQPRSSGRADWHHPDGDTARRSPSDATPSRGLPVRADRAYARHDGDQLRRPGFPRSRRDEPGASGARLGHTCVALFNFAPSQLEAGYTSGVLARDRFQQCAADFGIRGIHIASPADGGEAFATACAAAAHRTRMHRRDHNQLAVPRGTQRDPGSRPARPRRLLDRLDPRRPVRRDALAVAHFD